MDWFHSLCLSVTAGWRDQPPEPDGWEAERADARPGGGRQPLFYVFSSVWLNGPQNAATTTVAFKSTCLTELSRERFIILSLTRKKRKNTSQVALWEHKELLFWLWKTEPSIPNRKSTNDFLKWERGRISTIIDEDWGALASVCSEQQINLTLWMGRRPPMDGLQPPPCINPGPSVSATCAGEERFKRLPLKRH